MPRSRFFTVIIAISLTTLAIKTRSLVTHNITEDALNNDKTNEILLGLEYAIEAGITVTPKPMRGDRWLVTSAMQKAIRRGELERATQAATALWHIDCIAFWRRLLVIALEDVNAASPDTMVKVLTACAHGRWRTRMGDLQVGPHLMRLLCGSVKTRLADAVFILAERAPCYAGLRELFASADDTSLAEYARDETMPLAVRSLAIWNMAGTNKFRSDILPKRMGSVASTVSVLRATTTPSALVEACMGVIHRIPWPLMLFTPLIWQEIDQQSQTYVYREYIPLAPDVEGLPHYSADMFTRTGKASYRQLQQAVSELKPYTTQQIGLGIFYIEGHRVNNLLTSPGLAVIQTAGELADLESAGLDPLHYTELRTQLMANMGVLAEIRQKQLQQHLNEVAA